MNKTPQTSEDLPVRIAFLNIDMGRERTGVENSSLRRATLFTRALGLPPAILTSKYNPFLREAETELRQAGSVPREVPLHNMYDDFQDAGSFDPSRHDAAALVRPDQYPELNWVAVAVAPDHRVLDSDGTLVMYVVRDRTTRQLSYVNHFRDRRKWRRDVYDCRGFLSRIQFLAGPGSEVTQELYLRPDGTTAIIKTFRESGGKRELDLIQLVARNGQLIRTFPREADLIEYWLSCYIARDDARHVFIVDKNRVFYEPAIRLKERQADPSRVKVVPVIHAIHTTSHTQTVTGRLNSNYTAILNDLSRPDALVTLTQAQREDILSRFGNAPVLAIGHSYDSSVPRGDFSARDRCKVVYLARYSPEKRHDLAIRAFRKVVDRVPQATLHCYGLGNPSGPLLTNLRNLVAELDLAGSVHLHGWTSDGPNIYEASGMSISSSQAEAFPLTLMESLFHGCPIVAFDVPYGPRELVRQAETGFLVPFADEEAFADRVATILENEALHRDMSEAARRDAGRFAMRHTADLWRDLLNRLFRGEEDKRLAPAPRQSGAAPGSHGSGASGAMHRLYSADTPCQQ